MVRQFFHQEREYEEFLRGGGFVCNGLDMGSKWHRVHRAECRSLNHAGWARRGNRTNVRKAASRKLSELTDWLTKEYGPEGDGFAFCPFCDARTS